MVVGGQSLQNTQVKIGQGMNAVSPLKSAISNKAARQSSLGSLNAQSS